MHIRGDAEGVEGRMGVGLVDSGAEAAGSATRVADPVTGCGVVFIEGRVDDQQERIGTGRRDDLDGPAVASSRLGPWDSSLVMSGAPLGFAGSRTRRDGVDEGAGWWNGTPPGLNELRSADGWVSSLTPLNSQVPSLSRLKSAVVTTTTAAQSGPPA
jgi:hypothetical protein